MYSNKKIQPFISVVIPVKDGGNAFEKCLQGLKASDYKNYELIVVNDASSDDSEKVAIKYGARVFHTTDFPFKHKPDFPFQDSIGPAGARNIGVEHAKGKIIYFIDSDVVPKRDNLGRIANFFNENNDIDAVFGTYDDSPGCPSFISQYRNLLHSYIHQISLVEAETFWTGCGAIRKDIFLKIGGFDCKSFRRPSIEDIDIGYRLKDSGYRICLDKGLQVKHLKQWTFKSMLKTDVFQRGIPWSRLMLKRKYLPNDLNIQHHHRISGVIVLIVFSLIFFLIGYCSFDLVYSFVFREELLTNTTLFTTVLILIVALIANVILLNYRFYCFLFNQRGLRFAAQSIPLHLFYYLYSTATFIVLGADYYIPLIRKLRKQLGFITHT